MIENVSTQLTVFHCFAHCLLPGRAFAPLYVLLFLEKEAEIGGRVNQLIKKFWPNYLLRVRSVFLLNKNNDCICRHDDSHFKLAIKAQISLLIISAL